MMLLQEAQVKMASYKMAPLTVETVPLSQASGRVLSQDFVAAIDIPPADNSAMDGFAISANDFADKSIPYQLPISQRITAGAVPKPLEAGTAARIFTGAMIPPGANSVIIQENCAFESSELGEIARFNVRPEPGANIRPQGQDIQAGTRVLSAGHRLDAIDLSLLASLGCDSVEVFEPLTVAIFSTGNELAEPGNPLKPGQIYNSNRSLLLALCQEMGCKVWDCGIVEDSLESTKKALLGAAERAHLILSSGGVSVGEEDHIKHAITAVGQLEMWKVQIKPGKPVAFGSVGTAAFLGLPGNPVSSFVVFQLLAVPLMRALQGCEQEAPTVYSVKAGFAKPTTSREEYIRVKLQRNDRGALVAHRFANLSSGVMTSLSWADGLVRQSIDATIEVGQAVEFLPLRRGML